MGKNKLGPKSRLIGGLAGTRTPNFGSEDQRDIHFTTRPNIYNIHILFF